MNVILRNRQTGRTKELIELCALAEARGEVSYIVCMNHDEASRIFQESKKMNLTIGYPITSREFLNGQYYGQHIKNLFIDNADHLLQSITSIQIKAVTMEQSE